MVQSVKVSELVTRANLEVYAGAEYLKQRQITVSDISRPGLELTGYFNYYPHDRIQLFGRTEISFAKKMMPEERLMIFRKMCGEDTPAFIVSRSLPVPTEMLQAAKEAGIPVLGSKLATTRLSSLMTDYLEGRLAERRSLHGVLVDIYGIGVLITGDSGVGKSETALELVKRGHRLIADDRVEVYEQDEQTLIGEAPAILRHLLEIRGIGIIDVMNLFGAGAVRSDTPIQVVMHLETWTADKNFDRLGNGEETMQIFDVTLPKITIPVKIGRNLAIIIEVAAMNYRAKTMGYDATKTFESNLNQLIQENTLEDEAAEAAHKTTNDALPNTPTEKDKDQDKDGGQA
ncbi:HPr(Ser) kinase/phosphatase [Loigolactobacillus coryniformis]|jgi:HPr kinase/phosphorylase|uniref:HPr kinase/phosphorylase n=3 Tax=Loigolactobacillus coryniformis TaxID=1610 RepID=J3JBD0_9LACO|nr:HPr(Ser) kinase/phosphatase [Loigolactobacillus coryniformis]MDT3391052.1 HPr(Ser) kinase/phosphatase [Bacillota bacterium]OEH90812.1 serine kinase [Loigolactobacillus coryniformis subsp. coryniformis]ATO44370.1 HPr kinase/phosphorylase [Loigolactobacillus coryniformis subsp. torquens DSM 20004 = KCTC 3535]ATO56070.1 HPr kinase/phosphorylase [Loigolactobacillus coryniformis subsp. coryniformis KCTC 3167 = DSM 20001]EJN55614.1 HPr kinase/phosphorylase (HPrK/P) [Loigolactobacillus coryniformi